MAYYSSIILMILLSLGVMATQVAENSRMNAKRKRHFYLTYALIGLSALAEYAGVQLNGNPDLPVFLLIIVKGLDYILTPFAGGMLIMHIRNSSRKLQRVLSAILLGNTVFQILAMFFGWMTRIDENHVYSHGPLYPVYIFVFIAVIGIVALAMILYGKHFRRQNRNSLFAIMGLVIAGIAIQETTGGNCRTAYLALAVGAILLYIYNGEFSHLAMQNRIEIQNAKILTDAMTGVFSRAAYHEALDEYRDRANIPEKLAVFMVDTNGLKEVNDNLGHEAGDELIRATAMCAESALGGRCFRTGGDEFVVFTEMPRREESMREKYAERLKADLQENARAWTGNLAPQLTVSVGYALNSGSDPLSIEALVRKADQRMYEDKALYYRQTGRDRRRAAME